MDTEPFTDRPTLCELNDRDVNIVADPSTEFVDLVIAQFAEAPFTVYAVYDDESMFAAEMTSYGLVTMYGHSSLVACTLPNELLDVPIGGQNRDYNHRFVLPHEAVISPLREFLKYHRTPEELGWQRSRNDRPDDELWPDQPSPAHECLNAADIRVLLSAVDKASEISVVRTRPHNKTSLKRTETWQPTELANELETAMLSGHLTGGDIEIPLSGDVIIHGNHDGQFWLANSLL